MFFAKYSVVFAEKTIYNTNCQQYYIWIEKIYMDRK